MSAPDTRPTEAEIIARRAAERVLMEQAVRDETAFRERVLVKLENIDTRLEAMESSFAAHVAKDETQFNVVHQTIGDNKANLRIIFAVAAALMAVGGLIWGVVTWILDGAAK